MCESGLSPTVPLVPLGEIFRGAEAGPMSGVASHRCVWLDLQRQPGDIPGAHEPTLREQN